MSSTALSVRVCPEQARELILDWLMPLTENGTMDELFQQFVKELEPYASSAAQRVLRGKLLCADPDLIFQKLRPFLYQLRQTIQDHTLNPDAMAVASTDDREALFRATVDLADWLYVIDQVTSAGAVKKDEAAAAQASR